LSDSQSVALEVVPNEAKRNEDDYREILDWMLLAPNALVDCPPTSDWRDNTEWDQQQEDLFLAIHRFRGH
jgi:hypothetical protein